MSEPTEAELAQQIDGHYYVLITVVRALQGDTRALLKDDQENWISHAKWERTGPFEGKEGPYFVVSVQSSMHSVHVHWQARGPNTYAATRALCDRLVHLRQVVSGFVAGSRLSSAKELVALLEEEES